MAPQPPIAQLHLYKETRGDNQCPLGATVQILVSQPSAFAVRQRQARHILHASHIFDNENNYAEWYSATSTSVFHSRAESSPRSFLWRVVQEQKVLEVKSVDLSKHHNTNADPTYTIQLRFDRKLRHGAIAFADAQDETTLKLFALTVSNELYTLTLSKSFFTDLKASEKDVSQWTKVYQPNTLSISTPHRLIAYGDSNLFLALSDGRLLHLSQSKNGDGSRWKESIYGDGHWTSSLRGLVKWQGNNAIRYGETMLEPTTALSLALSPDTQHMLAVTMNHRLRIWNAVKGTIVFSQDILGQDREQDLPKDMIDPHNASYLRILKLQNAHKGFKYCAVTYSSHDAGEFKFWGIRDADEGNSGIVDCFSDCKFQPPDPSLGSDVNSTWRAVDFSVSSGEDDQSIEFWVLMQLSHQYQVFHLHCNFEELPSLWSTKWVCVKTQAADQPVSPSPNASPEELKDQWLQHILEPSRFPETLIESALWAYRISHQLGTSDRKVSLKIRIASTIEEQIKGKEILGNDCVQQGAIQQWYILWQYIQDFQNSGHGAISVSLDPQTDLLWIGLDDSCSFIRSCTRLEIASVNNSGVLVNHRDQIELPSVETEMGEEPKRPWDLAELLKAASDLRRSFNAQLQQNLTSALTKILWQQSDVGMPVILDEFSKLCNFAVEVEDSVLTDLDEALNPQGVQELDTDAFFAITDSFSAILPDHVPSRLYTKFGARTLVSAAREMIYNRENILLDLLACTAFVHSEVDSDTPMRFFDGPQIFERLLDLLKQYTILGWLVKHVNVDAKFNSPQKQRSTSPARLDWKPTALETLYVVNMKPQETENQTSGEAFTHGTEDLLQWTLGGNVPESVDQLPVTIQCRLLKLENFKLASEFARFLPSTPTAAYVKGRLLLAKGSPEDAVSLFENAANQLSKPFDVRAALADLLSPDEVTHFGKGVSSYCSHIIDLFNNRQPSHPNQAAHFAKLALEKLSKSATKQRSHLLTALFKASLQMEDFATAHDALIQHPQPETLLPDLITRILATPRAKSQLLSFSWPSNLHRHIDALLAKHANPKILAAWRLHHDDFRGAAAALLPSLETLQARVTRSAVDEEELEREYLTIINLLECAGKENAWVLSGGSSEVEAGFVERQKDRPERPRAKRKVVTLDALRTAYQKELDRRSVIEGGKYAFANGNDEGNADEMDLQ